MTLSIELNEEHELLYKFLRDIFLGGKMSNKEIVEMLIEEYIKKICTFDTYKMMISMLVETKKISEEEREILCQRKH